LDAHSLKPKHVEKLVERWFAEGRVPGTIKNRMTALRWWAQKIGKENVVARTNAAYAIPDRVYGFPSRVCSSGSYSTRRRR
jgi:hypothetical protein